MRPPEFIDIVAASKRLREYAVRTPLIENAMLNERVDGRVLIKAETLQRTGSFKFRGAYNAISQIPDAQRAGGVVACSSGNHAQGVAEAARLLGMPALIVMPADAPEIKKRGVLSRGGEIVEYDRGTENREAIADRLCTERQATLIPPFDNFDVIAGQGTCGMEIFAELNDRSVYADQLICCVGGGGLIAGIGVARDTLSPSTKMIGAEPVGFDDHRRSLITGERERNTKLTGSICDAILAPQPGEMTWAINSRSLDEIALLEDADALFAIKTAYETLKLVVEPGGSAALACALNGSVEMKDRTSVVVLTGGNVDPEVFKQAFDA